MKFLDAVDLLISSRFGPGVNQDSHTKAKELYEELKRAIHKIKPYLVDANVGDDFSEMTVRALSTAKGMVVIGCKNYGAMTTIPYSTYSELKFAYENGKLIIVIQLCEDWPPRPHPDIDGVGTAQNAFILGNKGLKRLIWSKRRWDAAECAKEVVEAFHRYITTMKSSQVNVPDSIEALPPPTPIDRKHMSSRALDKLKANLIDVCLISIHSPSMLHRLSLRSKALYDVERKLKVLNNNGLSILLVDGSDHDNIVALLDKDLHLRSIKSIILIGDGIEDVSWIPPDSNIGNRCGIFNLMEKIKKDTSCSTPVSLYLKYGSEVMKAELENEGFENVKVWKKTQVEKLWKDTDFTGPQKRKKKKYNMTNSYFQTQVVCDVWKDPDLIGPQGFLINHFASLRTDTRSNRYPDVVVLAWSPPTLSWFKKIRGNLTLKVGDAEVIDEMKTRIIESISSDRTQCLIIEQAHCTSSPYSGYNNDLYLRRRAIIFFGCQEASRYTRYSSVDWHYVCHDKHIQTVNDEIRAKNPDCVVIWADGSAMLNTNQCLQQTSIHGLPTIYIITHATETSKQKFQRPDWLDSQDMHTLSIDLPKTDIVLSEREVSIDVMLEGTSKCLSLGKVSNMQAVLTEDFFKCSGDKDVDYVGLGTFSPLINHEACFYKGDCGNMHFRIGVRDLKQLKLIFCQIFFPDNRLVLEGKLKNIHSDIQLQLKMSNALKVFRECVLQLETLTKEQVNTLKAIRKCKRAVVHAGAGTGKTFIGMHFILEFLLGKGCFAGFEGGLCLICVDACPLGNEIVKWLCIRLGASINLEDTNDKLKRIHFLHRSGSTLYQVTIDDSYGEKEVMWTEIEDDDDEKEREYKLIVVDEGHHVFRKLGDSNKKLKRNNFFHCSGSGPCQVSEIKRRRLSPRRLDSYGTHHEKKPNILQSNADARAFIRCDSSQATTRYEPVLGFAAFKCQQEEINNILQAKADARAFISSDSSQATTSLQEFRGFKWQQEKINSVLQANANARALILCDSSQATATYELPKEFRDDEKRQLKMNEVQRSLPMITETAKLFQQHDQADTRNHLDLLGKSQGIKPEVKLFHSHRSEYKTFEVYSNYTIKEIDKIQQLFPNENLHDAIAIIVANNQSREMLLRRGGFLADRLKAKGFCAVSAIEASQRFSNKRPSKSSGAYIIVDTISSLNGMERPFVIAVDMDRTVKGKDPKSVTEIHSAVTRAMLHICIINRYINNGWMSFFAFTDTKETHASDSKRPEDVKESRSIENSISETQFEPNDPLPSAPPPRQNDKSRETKGEIRFGAASAIVDGEIVDTVKYKASDVQLMASTTFFNVSKSDLNAIGNENMPIPVFRPLPTNCGLTPFEPYVYGGGGKVPNVPFVEISPEVKEINDRAFYENNLLERIIIPKNVTHIGTECLMNCYNLREVSFEEPSSLVCIAEGAFCGCSKIEDIKLPNSLKTLKRNAFEGCSGLKKVELSHNMTIIDESTFDGCSSLTAVEGMYAITTIEGWAFKGCSSLQWIDVKASAYIHRDALVGCNARMSRI